MSNYKGLPVCQAKTGHDELRSDSSMEFLRRTTELVSITLNSGKGCGLEKLQPVIDAVGVDCGP
jgi:hypothetical protein